MAIIDDLNNLQANILTAKQVLADNISSKGVGVSSKDTLTSLANSVSKIEQGSGGSGQWVLPKYIRFGYSNWETISDEVKYADWSNINSMNNMFYNNNILKTFDLNDIVTSKIESLANMFYYCSQLTSLDLSKWDTSKVTDMSSMFTFCQSLTSLDLSNWNTSNVTTMSWMFRNCSKLTSLDLSSFNTSKINNMMMMFYGCSSLTSLDLSNWDTSNVTSYSSMFTNCNSLSEIKMCNCSDSTIQFITDRLNDAGILDNITIITECESNNEVNSLNCNFDKSTPITDLYFDMDNLPEEMGYYWVGFSFNPNQEGDCNNCNWSNGDLRISLFENRYDGIIMNGQIRDLEQVNGLYHLHLNEPLYFICGEANSHLERYYLTPDKSASYCDTISFRWDGNATDSFEFELETRTRNVYREDCKDNGDGTYTYTTTLSDMEIDNLTYCSYAFSLSRYLVELIKFPCTDNVTEMNNMFSNSNVETLDLSSFDTSKVDNISGMFQFCSDLRTLDLSNWRLKNVVDITGMFNHCDNLREIYLKNSDDITYNVIYRAIKESGISATIITK